VQIISHIAAIQSLADSLRNQGKKIGFVPTMGFLHEGHLSLIRRARLACDVVIASIFVNPTQFGPAEDFARYPRDEAGDREKCGSAGVDILFMPETAEMYPDKPAVFVNVEGVSDMLEGAVRPGHYQGVATVVAKLFHIVKPHAAFFGQKDYQQCIVIRRMATGLDMDVEIEIRPTVREPDGLAMSSRNSYLSAEERRAAPVIFRALTEGVRLIHDGQQDPEMLRNAMRAIIQEEKGIVVDYLEIADHETLAPLLRVLNKAVILAAVRIGRTRLIDNILVF
jgi:pantoate--beta-alanine ligase